MSRLQQVGPASGFVFRVERARGPQWCAKWREPGGRQVKRRVGPAWTRRGRPDPGFFTKRTAEDWLRAILMELDHSPWPAPSSTSRSPPQRASGSGTWRRTAR